MTNNLPAVPYRSVVVGQWLGEDGTWQERSVALPTNLPPQRLALLVQASRWEDPTILRWLLGLPLYGGTHLVALSAVNIIHRTGDGPGFACGTVSDVVGPTLKMPLSEAVATIIGEDGKRHRPRPCRICFASGLLVATDNQEGNGHGGTTA